MDVESSSVHPLLHLHTKGTRMSLYTLYPGLKQALSHRSPTYDLLDGYSVEMTSSPILLLVTPTALALIVVVKETVITDVQAPLLLLFVIL